jgi:HD-GYP domain-containing protein (c-di-GMP phosphodiesterase class II)
LLMSTTSVSLSSTLGPAIHGHVAVSGHVLRSLAPFHFDLFISDGHAKPRLFRARDSEFDLDDTALVRRQDSQWFYIRDKDRDAYQSRLHDNLDKILQCAEVPVVERFDVLLGAVSAELRSAFRLLKADAAVEESQNAGRHVADLVSQNSILPDELMAIAQHHNDTFAHVLNASNFAVWLGQAYGFRDPDYLRRIAVGAMLHDVGKRFLPKRLLGNPARISCSERQLLAQHPQKGYEELQGRADLSFGQLMMIYQHHERIDGEGYPVGLVGDEIHPWARLCAVVDTFENLTSRRYSRKTTEPAVALAELRGMGGTRLDSEMVRCFCSKMSSR